MISEPFAVWPVVGQRKRTGDRWSRSRSDSDASQTPNRTRRTVGCG